VGETNRGGLVVLAGSLVLAIGSVLAWAKVEAGIFSRSIAGTDGDGKITIAIAALVGVAALVGMLRTPVSGGAVIVALVGGIAAGGVAVYDIVNVNDKIHEVSATTSLVTASVGIGLYVCAAGAAMIVVGALMVSSAERAAEAPFGATRACPYCAEQIQPAARVCRFCGRGVDPVTAPAPAEGWYPDPSGRHPDRWWNGTAWTRWVRDRPGGTRSDDPQPWTS
jgi:Protein of unknown function (DUF2510)